MPWLSDLAGFDSWTAARVLAAAGVYLAALVAIGSHLFLRAFAGLAVAEDRRMARTVFASALIGGALVLLQWPLQAAFLGGELQAALDPALLGMLFDGPQGARIVLLVSGFALLATAATGPVGRGGMRGWLAMIGGFAVLIGFLQVGHTRGEPRLLLAGLLLLHLPAAAFWVAALAPLYRLAGDDRDGASTAPLLRRFGRIGLLFVPVLLAAGIGLGWLLLGGPGPLLQTAYGQWLLVKIMLVALLLLLAALNKLRLVPAIERGEPQAARTLRRSIVAEATLVLAILLVTAVLTTRVSPHDESAVREAQPAPPYAMMRGA
jgi:copper resistance protein D